MSTTDLWMRDTVAKYGLALVLACLLALYAAKMWPKFQAFVYRTHLLGFETECAELAASHKERLFKALQEAVSHDEILRAIGTVRLLEIGVKTGENIPFYPDGTYLITVDWNLKLKEYLTRGNCSWKFSHVYLERQIHGDGSSLKEIPTGCVDAVVTTRSLCSAKSLKATLNEIRRVLAPGGKYLFMEHVPAAKGSFVHWLQVSLTRSGIWPALFGDCRLDVDPTQAMRNAGFAKVKFTEVRLEGYVTHPLRFMLSRDHVVGVATR